MNDRNEALDGLRGVAAIAVVLAHSGPELHQRILPEAPLAVDFFFALSGYVLGRANGPGLASGRLSLRQFVWKRLVRLCPMLAIGAILGVSFLLRHPMFERRHLLPLLVLASLGLPAWRSFAGTPYPLNPPEWSLTNELGANFVWALITRWLTVPMLLAIIAVSWAAMSWTAGLDHSLISTSGGHQLVRNAFRTAFAFCVGLLIARQPRLRPVTAPFVALALAILAMSAVDPRGHEAVYEVFCASVVVPVLVYAGAASAERGVHLRSLGLLSYPLYATHYPLLRWWAVRAPPGPLSVAVALAITVGVALALTPIESRLRTALVAGGARTRALIAQVRTRPGRPA